MGFSLKLQEPAFTTNAASPGIVRAISKFGTDDQSLAVLQFWSRNEVMVVEVVSSTLSTQTAASNRLLPAAAAGPRLSSSSKVPQTNTVLRLRRDFQLGCRL